MRRHPGAVRKENVFATGHVRAGVLPVLMGDITSIEALLGYVAAFFAQVIGNTPAVSTIVEVMFNPDSTTWIVSLAFSSVLETISRTGISQRIELRSAAPLNARFGVEWPIRMTEVSALKLVYLHSLGGTGYVTPITALSIGCFRAATFSEPRAIIWLDVSPTVKWVVLNLPSDSSWKQPFGQPQRRVSSSSL
jgi:hypothetical protein